MDQYRTEYALLPHSGDINSASDIDNDTAAILTITRRATDPESDDTFDDLSLEDQLDILETFDEQHCIVVRDEENTVQAVANIRDEEAQVWLEAIAVHRESEGHGLSDMLIELICTHALERNIKIIGSNALPGAVNAHGRWGFIEAEYQPSSAFTLMYRYL